LWSLLRGKAKSCGQSGYKSNQKTRQDEWVAGGAGRAGGAVDRVINSFGQQGDGEKQQAGKHLTQWQKQKILFEFLKIKAEHRNRKSLF